MPRKRCADCGSTIGASSVTLATELALCAACARAQVCSARTKATELPAESGIDPANPPNGAWFRSHGATQRLGLTLRSSSAIALGVFAVAWNGTFAVFWANAGGPAYEGPPVTLLFVLPFLMAGAALISVTVLFIWGRSEVVIDGELARWTYGVGRLGIRRSFNVNEVVAIEPVSVEGREDEWHPAYGMNARVRLRDSSRSVRIWLGGNENRAAFVIGMLQALLPPRQSAGETAPGAGVSSESGRSAYSTCEISERHRPEG